MKSFLQSKDGATRLGPYNSRTGAELARRDLEAKYGKLEHVDVAWPDSEGLC